jgi:hypothetical protein
MLDQASHFKKCRDLAANLANQAEEGGALTYWQRVDVIFMFAANLLGVVGIAELRKSLAADNIDRTKQAFFDKVTGRVK